MAISHIYREALSEADPQAIREIISMFKAIIGKAIESESPDIEVAIAAEETVSVGGLEGIASDLTGIGEAAFEMVGEFLFLAVAVRGTYKLYQVLEEYKNRLRNHHECLKKEHLASLSKLEEELDNKHAKVTTQAVGGVIEDCRRTSSREHPRH